MANKYFIVLIVQFIVVMVGNIGWLNDALCTMSIG